MRALSLSVCVVFASFAFPAASWSQEHDHPEQGPRGGELIELGDEEYHAELVLDEKNNLVAVHLLDSTAKKTVFTEAPTVAINLKVGGRGVQFKLNASPLEGEPEGETSRFTARNAELMKGLHAEDAGARLQVKIAGKNFVGKIVLAHDDHDHEGEGKEAPAKAGKGKSSGKAPTGKKKS